MIVRNPHIPEERKVVNQFDEPEIWRDIVHFPGYQVSSEGRVQFVPEKRILISKKNALGEPIVHFSYHEFSYSGPIWRLVLRGFYEVGVGELFDIVPVYRDGHLGNLDVFNLTWEKKDGTPLVFKRNEEGNWRRLRKVARKVRIVDTGEIFESINSLADSKGWSPNPLYMHLRGLSKKAHGVTLEWVD